MSDEENYWALRHRIEFFDRVLALVGRIEFEQLMFSEYSGIGDAENGNFEAQLETDLAVTVNVAVDPRGEIKAMIAKRQDKFGPLTTQELRPESGLWVAVSAWVADFESTRDEDLDSDDDHE